MSPIPPDDAEPKEPSNRADEPDQLLAEYFEPEAEYLALKIGGDRDALLRHIARRAVYEARLQKLAARGKRG